MRLSPPYHRGEGGGSVVVDSLLSVALVVGFCVYSMFCCALLCVLSSFAIILMEKRQLVALLCFLLYCHARIQKVLSEGVQP